MVFGHQSLHIINFRIRLENLVKRANRNVRVNVEFDDFVANEHLIVLIGTLDH